MIKQYYTSAEIADMQLKNWPKSRNAVNRLSRQQKWKRVPNTSSGRLTFAFKDLPVSLQDDIKFSISGLNDPQQLKSALREIVREEIARALEGLNV